MNEDNKEIEIIQNSEVNNNNNNNNVNATGVVEEVSFKYSDGEVGLQNSHKEVSESQNVVGTNINEVSINVDSSSLETVAVANDSIFNKSEEVTTGSLKEGKEYLNEKKGFPYGMVIGFVVLIICAFFIDYIVDFVQNVVPSNKDEIQEESSAFDDDESKDDESSEVNEKSEK